MYRTETEFLAALRHACMIRTGVSAAVHRTICLCDRPPFYCEECDKESTTIRFDVAYQGFLCEGCIERRAEIANERNETRSHE